MGKFEVKLLQILYAVVLWLSGRVKRASQNQRNAILFV